MTDDRKAMTDLDRWVLVSLTLIGLALIASSVITRDQIYLAALGSVGLLAWIYFAFFR
jgi:hypothetical protein